MLASNRRTAFVGREHELARLAEVLAEAACSRGGLVLVAGEPGIGKTRLLAETAERARETGWLVLSGAAYDVEGMPPYLPFVEALQDYARSCSTEKLQAQLGTSAPDVALLLPEVRQRLPHLPSSAPLDTETARYRLFESVADFLLTVARAPDAPGLLLCLEDLHWADEATLLLLEHLGRRIAEAPLLVVATYRDTELDTGRPLARSLERFGRQGPDGALRVELDRFPEADTATLLAALAGHAPPAQLVRVIHAETEGNPFFVHEVYRYLAAADRLFDAQGAWRPSVRLGEVDLPSSVRLVLDRRLAQVSASCRQILSLAAVIGRTFSCDLLGAVAGIDEEDLLEALDEAEHAHLLGSAPEDAAGLVCFAHELIRQTLLAGLSLPHRQQLHRRVAEGIERLHAGDLTPHVAELAGHYLLAGAAGDPAKAVSYARQAGEAAEAVFAYEQAVVHYDAALRALELTSESDPMQRAELLLALGLAQEKTGMWRGLNSLLAAAGTAQAAGRADLVLRAVLATANLVVAEDARLVPFLQDLLSGPETEDAVLRAKLLSYLGAQPPAGPIDQRRALLDEALAMARHARDPKALAFVLHARREGLLRGRAYTPDDVEEAWPLAAEQAEMAEVAGDGSRAVSGHCVALQMRMWLGCIAPAEIDRLIELHYRYGTELHQGTQLGHALSLRVMKALLDGRLDAVEPLVRDALATLERFGPSLADPSEFAWQRMWQLMLLRREQGRLAEAAPAFRDYAAQPPVQPLKRAGLALLVAELGEEAEARRHLEELSADGFAGIPYDYSRGAALALLARVCFMVGDVERGRVLYDLLLPHATLNVFPNYSFVYFGSTSWYLGLLAALFARAGVPGPGWDEATRHFEVALAMHAQLGARPLLAHTARDYAEMLLAHGRRADAAQARELLERALAIYQDLDMAAHAEHAATRLAATPIAPLAAPVYPDDLTAREVEVLRLLAAGTSNRAIGAALVISLNTVERHINHIFQKIGAQNRVEAARYADRHGLAD